MNPHRRRLAAGLLALAAARAVPARSAEPWPTQPLRLMVVYAAGGAGDGMARVLAEALHRVLGVPVQIDNRPGAGGSIGMAALARAAPDGHTLAFSALSPLSLRPWIAHDAADLADLVVPVASVMRTPVLVVGTPAFEGTRFEDVITLARQRPDQLRWASSGVATAGHLVMAQVCRQSGSRITHVPYQGGGRPLTDALGGQFELLSTQVGAAQLGLIQQGRLKPLAVGASARLTSLPAAPTLAELGYHAANQDSLFGVFAPAQISTALMERLNSAVNQALQHEPVREYLRQAHSLPGGGSAAEFARELTLARARNQALLRADPKLLD